MASLQRTSLGLSPIQRYQLKVLAEKFQIDQSNVIRLAIARMAEQEGVPPKPGRKSNL